MEINLMMTAKLMKNDHRSVLQKIASHLIGGQCNLFIVL
jgi:hypothetical protein